MGAQPGDRLLLPLVKYRRYGTPELKVDEYWVQANWSAWLVDASGTCRRSTAIDIGGPNEFSLTELEGMMTAETGKLPSMFR
jgi:hypothetical protein